MNHELGATIVLGVLALIVLFLSARRGFFQKETKPWIVPLTLVQLIGAFAIYFLGSFFLNQIFAAFWRHSLLIHYVAAASWLNFGISLIIAICLGLYLKALPPLVKRGILIRNPPDHPLYQDVWAAFYSWVVAFPLVLFLSQALEILVLKLFQVHKLPDQLAVKFLKLTFGNPVHFLLAIVSIIVLAPLIEETLFRGFLQTFIRKHLGSKQAIFITSFCFSLFHYSPGQGLGNIMILISLFVLALFLGFIYEKQGSLLAPIILHASFNAVSVINLYAFGDLFP